MKEFDFEMLQDEACDKAISYVLSSGFEGVTAVDLMYGSESAYIDDSFIAKVKRGIRNITTFRTATKVKNLAKDVDNLSKEKVSQGPTADISINYEMFQNFIKFLKNRSSNVNKAIPMLAELGNMIKELEDNKELKNKIKQMDINNNSVRAAVIAPIGAFFNGYNTLDAIKDLKNSKAEGGFIHGLNLAAVVSGVLCVLCFSGVFIHSIYKNYKSKNLNTSDKDALILKELQSKIEPILNQASKIVRTIVGVSANSDDIANQIKSIADRERLDIIFNASLLKHTQQVSYEEKVKIVDELKSVGSSNIINAFNTNYLKKTLTTYNKISAKLKSVGFLTSESEIILNNSNIILGYLLNSTEIAMLTLQGVLEDAKKY